MPFNDFIVSTILFITFYICSFCNSVLCQSGKIGVIGICHLFKIALEWFKLAIHENLSDIEALLHVLEF